ncbi:glycosyltransferase family 2 protein [Alkalicoccus daliensis]|uniref:Glycosyltransferase, catalytic subunit of cellulose synthase and poly-beta-1,6-N-acetylglucosamine synthase n=1 Tax=Alkalicoccus daliensis TaxID=745820 RepID=A0A1H0K734_9BACI|nr:glycosyltransferase [Alkalicoccus daliensis]SDO51560.1 Glycosyltransferase, catalytic subunit of cellulose synthase and poly-beta-1,6-N-acetylglucosamine synthase [Alkalicoccus daliensis]
MDWVSLLLTIMAYAIIVYMIIVCVIYVALFLFSSPKIHREHGLHREEPIEELQESQDTYPVSILVPAYNEEVGVVTTVRSLLALKYPQFEIIVVNDGSKDATNDKMIKAFQMKKVNSAIKMHFPTAEVVAVYHSEIYPNVVLVEKENGGKADALNAGINISKYPYFAAIDGDSILERDALLKTMKPIIDSNGNVTVTGGTVRIANGSKIRQSVVEQIALPKHPLAIMQIVEYFRAFLIGRLGLSRVNALLIISGAFGVFEKERVIRAGGYETKTIGEDMELVVRIHRMLKDEKSKQRIEYIQDPVCWTEAPSDIKSLKSQRIRWQKGLAETLWRHKKMMFNPKYKSIGLFSMPYYLFVELLSAVFELLGYAIIILGIFFGLVNPQVTLLMVIVTVLYGSLLSALAILLEEWTYHKYRDLKSVVVLYGWALTESFWYRPFMVWCRVVGFFSVLKKKQTWGEMKRTGISEDEEKEL